MEVQIDAAEKSGKPYSQWLGHMLVYGKYPVHTDLCTYIDTSPTQDNNNKPIKTGDTIWIYNLGCIGKSIARIEKVFMFLKENDISLRIQTIGSPNYHSSVKLGPDELDLYVKLLANLNCKTKSNLESSSVSFEQAESSPAVTHQSHSTDAPRRGRGRPPKTPITMDALNKKGKTVLRKYCMSTQKNKFERYFKIFQSSYYYREEFQNEIGSHGITRKTFQALVRECKEKDPSYKYYHKPKKN